MPTLFEPTQEEMSLILKVIKEYSPILIRAWRRDLATFWIWLKTQDGREYRSWHTNITPGGCGLTPVDNASRDYGGDYLSSQMNTLSQWQELDLKSLVSGEYEMPGKKNFRRYIMTDDGHNKYWEIWMPNDRAVTTHWGAIGNDGNSLTKNYNSEREALSQYNKLCRSKTAKGYLLDDTHKGPAQYAGKLKMPDVPQGPKIPTAAEEGLSEVMDILDIE